MDLKSGRKFPSKVWALVLSPALALQAAPLAGGLDTGAREGIGVVERAGQSLPPDIRCVDDRGRELALGEFLDRPAVLSLVYFTCEHICPQVLAGLGKLVSDLDLTAA